MKNTVIFYFLFIVYGGGRLIAQKHNPKYLLKDNAALKKI
jgi:hypothetical protein